MFIVLWIALGFYGVYLFTKLELDDGNDYTLGMFLWSILGALFLGPAIPAIYFLMTHPNFFDFVLIKGKEKKND